MVTSEELTNKEKLERQLNPPSRRGRIRIVERPPAIPRKCAVTGRASAAWFIDLGFHTDDFRGQVYICDDIVNEIAKITGYVKSDEYVEQIKANIELSDLLQEVEAENKRLREFVDGLGLSSDTGSVNRADRISDLASSVAESATKNNVHSDVGQEGPTDSGSPEQSSQQGLANLSSPNLKRLAI